MKNISKQSGFVSIFSALIIMGVIALIAIGFTYSTRQASRRTIDDQLNTQAYYSAESGINNAIANLDDYIGGSPTTCESDDVDTGTDTSYSCVLVDAEPPELIYSGIPVVGGGQPILANLELDEDVNYFHFEFDSASDSGASIPSTGFTGSRPELPNVSGWGTNVGILRVDIVPVGNLSRTNLTNDTYTFYLYPTSGSGASSTASVTSGVNEAGDVFLVECNNPSGLRCGVTVTLNGSGAGQRHYRARLQSLYNPLQASIAAQNIPGSNLDVTNGQAVIDSTGRAGDIYKRVQARLPLSGAGGFTDGSVAQAAISTASAVCKRYEAVPGATTVNDPGLSSVSLAEYCGFN